MDRVALYLRRTRGPCSRCGAPYGGPLFKGHCCVACLHGRWCPCRHGRQWTDTTEAGRAWLETWDGQLVLDLVGDG